MSFFGGGSSGLSNVRPKPFGVDEKKLSTNEQARPVPYFSGKTRIGVTFISQVFDIKKAAVTRDIGKQKTRTGTSYFFSFAAMIAHGPVDGIHAVILNSEKVWEGSLARNASNPDYVDLTIEDYGLIRFYWGTETQTRDEYLWIKGGGYAETGPEHPPYRGFSYLVAHQLFAGFNQTNIQNLEVIVSRYPAFGDSPSAIETDANLANVFYELLTNPRLGRGIDTALIDADAIEAVGVQLASERIGCSPFLNSQDETHNWIDKLFEYIDAYPIVSRSGLLSLGLVRPLLDLSGVPVVDESVMSEPLRITPEDWSTTFNETNVKFSNLNSNYDPDARVWRDRGNFAVTGQLNPQTIERPWVSSPAVAAFMAKANGRMKAIPEAKGNLRLRMTSLFDDLTPGALFKINYPPRGYSELLCRVTERSVQDPARPSYQIGFKLDRTYLVNGLEVGVDDIEFSAASEADPIVDLRLLELPVGLSPNGKETLTVLAARPEGITAGYKVHLGKNYDETGEIAADSYDVIDTHDRFAWHGLLMQEFSASEPIIAADGLIVQLSGPDTELDDMTMFDGLADELLIFVGDEILSVSEATVVGTDAYHLSVIRGRYGSQLETHASGAEVFIVRRSELQQLQHPIFQPFNNVVLKVQSFTGQAQADLDLEPEQTIAIAGRVYTEPPLTNLSVNGDDVAPSYTTGQSIAITWTLTDGGELPHRSDLLERIVVLEFYNSTGLTLLGTATTPAGELSLTNAELQVLLGGSEVTFTLRISLRTISDWWEVDTEKIEILVTKV